MRARRLSNGALDEDGEIYYRRSRSMGRINLCSFFKFLHRCLFMKIIEQLGPEHAERSLTCKYVESHLKRKIILLAQV